MTDIAGDGFFFATLLKYKSKEWVSRLFIPYSVCFATACIVSLFAVAVKIRSGFNLRSCCPCPVLGGGAFLRLFVDKFRSRQPGMRRHSIGGVVVAPALMENKRASDLKERFDVHKMERMTLLLNLTLAVFEDIPMGTARVSGFLGASGASLGSSKGHQRPPSHWVSDAGVMSAVFLFQSMRECIGAADPSSERADRICDLKPTETLVLLMSMLVRRCIPTLAFPLWSEGACEWAGWQAWWEQLTERGMGWTWCDLRPSGVLASVVS